MAGGQLLTSARGAVTYGLTVALVGLAISTSHGTMVPTGAGAVALSGSALTSAQGTLTQNPSTLLSGAEGVFSQGAVVARARSLVALSTGTAVPAPEIPLSGQALTGAQGTVTSGLPNAPQLSGQALTSAQQSLAATLSQALTGSASTSATGTLTPLNTPLTSTGQSITSADGTLVASGPLSVTVHISGVECTTEQGAVDSTPALTGSALASGHGLVAPSEAVALTGQAVTVLQGAATVEQSPDDLFIQSRTGTAAFTTTVPLVGEVITGTLGAITLTDGEQGLTGIGSTSATGTALNVVSCALLGEALTGEQYFVSAPGFAALTGQAITGVQGAIFTTDDRALALTGSGLTLAIGAVEAGPRGALTSSVLAGGTGTFLVSGGNRQTALAGHAMSMVLGSLDAIGQEPIQPTPSLEGCGIISGVAVESVPTRKAVSAEGCFVVAHTAEEVGSRRDALAPTGD